MFFWSVLALQASGAFRKVCLNVPKLFRLLHVVKYTRGPGVPVKIERLVASEDWNYTYDGREWWERCYFHSLSPLDDVAPQPDSEHPVAAWIPATEALRGMMYDNERRTIAAALNK